MLRVQLVQHEVANKKRRQEIEQENLRGEYHRGLSYERGAKAPLRYGVVMKKSISTTNSHKGSRRRPTSPHKASETSDLITH